MPALYQTLHKHICRTTIYVPTDCYYNLKDDAGNFIYLKQYVPTNSAVKVMFFCGRKNVCFQFQEVDL